MARYIDKDHWEEEILIPDTNTPILGGQPVWEGDRLVDGFSNIPPAILADRTRHLKNKIDNIEADIDADFSSFIRKEDNLSDLEDIQQAKYNLDLNLVDNTRDMDKPVSTQQAEAIQSVRDDLASSDPGKGAEMVGLNFGGPDSVARTVLDKLAECRSVFDFGAKGDCMGTLTGTDDSPAFAKALHWLESGPNRRIIFPDGHLYRMSSGVSVNFNKSSLPGSIIMYGAVCPDPGIGRAFLITNGWGGQYRMQVYGGGQTADYSQADPPGADEAFVFRGMKRSEIVVIGSDYKGRLLRIPKHESGELSTSTLNIQYIRATDRLGAGHPVEDRIESSVGQAFYIDSGSTAFGAIQCAWCFMERYGPVIENTTDITVHDLESQWRGNTGMSLRGVVSFWGGSIKVGDESKALDLLTIESSATRDSQNIAIDQLFCVGGKDGLVVRNVGVTAGQGISIGAYYSRLNGGRGALLENCSDFNIDMISYGDGVGLHLAGTTAKGQINAQITGSRRQAFIADSTVQGNIDIRGLFYDGNVDVAEGVPLIEINTTDFIQFAHAICSSARVDYLYKLVPGNNVHVVGGRVFRTGSTQIYNNTPRYSDAVFGARTKTRGAQTVQAGNTSFDIAHGLSGTPASVAVTPRTAEAAGMYVNNIGPTTFRVNFPTALSAVTEVLWRAELSYGSQ